jgi:hypothetical protein
LKGSKFLTFFKVNKCEFVWIWKFTPAFDGKWNFNRTLIQFWPFIRGNRTNQVSLKFKSNNNYILRLYSISILILIIFYDSIQNFNFNLKIHWKFCASIQTINYRMQELFVGFNHFSPIGILPNNFRIFQKVFSNNEKLLTSFRRALRERLFTDFRSSERLSTILLRIILFQISFKLIIDMT